MSERTGPPGNWLTRRLRQWWRGGDLLAQVWVETGTLRDRVDDLERTLRAQSSDLVQRLDALHANVSDLTQQLDAVGGSVETATQNGLAEVRRGMGSVEDVVRAQYDGLRSARRELAAVRASESYRAIWDEHEPLVSVVIATFNRADLVAERAVASALRQTYRNLEVVVVGDHCTDDTEERLRRLGDPRVRFHNLPLRSAFEADPHRRWSASGAMPGNLAVELADGVWLAPLGDDDEFDADHVELLLAEALEHRHELVYGRFHRYWADRDEWDEVGAFPPVLGQFSFQAALYLRALAFFDKDPRSWVLDEPNDWNLARRMLEAGVRFGFLDRHIATVVTSDHHIEDVEERSALHRAVPSRRPPSPRGPERRP